VTISFKGKFHQESSKRKVHIIIKFQMQSNDRVFDFAYASTVSTYFTCLLGESVMNFMHMFPYLYFQKYSVRLHSPLIRGFQ
jgi:hypothetical protein